MKSVISDLRFDISCQLRLPSVSICQQLLFVIEEFFMVDGGIFVVRTLNNSVDGTGFLAKSTVNALCHVNIVSSGSSGTVGSGLAFNCDCVGWTGSCAQLACDTSE